MNRILSREAEESERYSVQEKLKIGIVGISDYAGTSFLAGCLARYLANTGKHKPAVIEFGKGTLFDSYGMDKRFAGRSYVQFYSSVAQNKSIRGLQNMDEGINWILRSPDEQNINLTFEQKLRLINHSRGDAILCDFSGNQDYGSQLNQLLLSMDQIIAVIDPMPSKMLAGHHLLCGIKEMEQNFKISEAHCFLKDAGTIIYIINKFNEGVNRRQMLSYLKIRKPIILPLLKTELIYTAEYNCKIPYSLSEAKSMLQKPLSEIAAMLNF